ncbi:MAG: lipopolysaccharide heptosyltransferase II [Victivallales bacterium]|nr:lipopolysaccharide heptosyltransferase II [Victivallales bacterium]
MKILIIKPSSLGDIVHVFPAVDILLEAYPEAEIDWLVHPAFVGMVKYCRNFRRAIIFPRRELGRAATFWPYLNRLARKLRRERYDLVVDFQGLLRSALFGRIARCRRYVGFGHPREAAARFLYRENYEVPSEFVHAVDRNCYLAGRIVNRPYRPRLPLPLPVNPENSVRAEMRLRQAGITPGTRFLGVIPGARWESKQWPPEFFAAVIDRLSGGDEHLRFVLLGSPADRAGAEAVLQAAAHPERLRSLVGETRIGELVEIIRQSSGLLTNDSGPMHIAAALQVPVFAVFGPTVPEKTGPYGNIHTVWQPELSCCRCLKRQCPTGAAPCHRAIDPEQAAETIMSKLSGEYRDEAKK